MKSKLRSIHFYRFIFFITILISVYVTWCVTNNVLDSDAASELVLAKHLFDTKQLFSSDWIYSTELRVVHTHLIFAPLFFIFSDWHKVRFVGTVICHILMVLSYGYMVKPLKMDKKVFYIGSTLLLLPVSVAYGRVMLYHCHYIPHIIISFVLMGLVLRIVDFSKKSLYITSNIIALLIISFINGTIGVRGLLIFHIPLLFSAVVMLISRDFENPDSSAITQSKYYTPLIVTAASATFACLGFIFNSTYFRTRYTFGDYTEYELGIINKDNKFVDLVYGLLHQFGFRDNTELISILGIASVVGVFCGFFLIGIAVNRFIKTNTQNKEAAVKKYLFQSMFISLTTVLLCVFIFTSEKVVYYYPLYLTPVTTWLIAFLVCVIEDIPDRVNKFNSKHFLPYIFAIVFALNGIINIGFYMGIEKFIQPYEGLSYQDKNVVAELSGPVEYIKSNGYTHGYATYWFNNIITEMTDGQILMSNIGHNGPDISYYDWLGVKSQRKYYEKNFLLLKFDELQVIENVPGLKENSTLVYDNGIYYVYGFSDEHYFHDLLTS